MQEKSDIGLLKQILRAINVVTNRLDGLEETLDNQQEVLNQMAANQQDLDAALTAVQQAVQNLQGQLTAEIQKIQDLINAGTPPDFTTEVTALASIASSVQAVADQLKAVLGV